MRQGFLSVAPAVLRTSTPKESIVTKQSDVQKAPLEGSGWEGVHWIKCSPTKCEEWSSDPQIHVKYRQAWQPALNKGFQRQAD